LKRHRDIEGEEKKKQSHSKDEFWSVLRVGPEQVGRGARGDLVQKFLNFHEWGGVCAALHPREASIGQRFSIRFLLKESRVSRKLYKFPERVSRKKKRQTREDGPRGKTGFSFVFWGRMLSRGFHNEGRRM